MSDNFYLEVPGFSDFKQISDDRYYYQVPDDWLIIVSDIKGSTQAVQSGRYKDVNLIGAACITTVINAIKAEIPFVFGGDGASLLIPPEYKDSVFRALKDLISVSQVNFGLTLKAGYVPVKELTDQGLKMEIARFTPWQNRSLALFRGGALTEAEKLIKRHAEYQLEADQQPPDDLLFDGLTCRWNKIISKKGVTMSLLITPLPLSDNSQMGTVVHEISDILGGNLEEGNPVNIELSSYKSVTECLQQELRFHPGWRSAGYMKRVVEIGMAVPLFGWGLHNYFPKANHYYHNLKSHADFQKYDDTLRMIIDCTPEQSRNIEAYLLQAEEKGQLIFGLHRSDAAQMTCYVESLGDGEHLHFIDGSNGGYSLASIRLKEQMKKIQSVRKTSLAASEIQFLQELMPDPEYHSGEDSDRIDQ